MVEPTPPVAEIPPAPIRRTRVDRRIGPSKHDEIINDVLKHLTTLNTGLLAILSAFNQQIQEILKAFPYFGTYFIYSFYTSLLFCMVGFILSIVSLQRLAPQVRHRIKLLRDTIIVFAALGYVAALMFLVTVYSSSLGLP